MSHMGSFNSEISYPQMSKGRKLGTMYGTVKYVLCFNLACSFKLQGLVDIFNMSTGEVQHSKPISEPQIYHKLQFNVGVTCNNEI